MTDYHAEVASDAWNAIENYVSDMVDHWRSSGEISDDLLNDYADGDSYHHENHVDNDYSLTEAATLLDQLSDHEETDSGLWHGLEPRRAIAAQAAYTYGNAVMSEWIDIIGSINDELEGLRSEMLDAYAERKTDKVVLDECEMDEIEEIEEIEEADDADFDIEAAIEDAGERLIRFIVWDHDRKPIDTDLHKAMRQGFWKGETIAASAYADLLMEHGKEQDAKDLKQIINIGVTQ
jgi:hypothetical protein